MNPVTVGTYEAKTKLTSLLARVARGGEVIITRHEKPVARLTSVQPEPRHSVAGALDGLAAIRAQARPGPDSLKDLIVAGRRT